MLVTCHYFITVTFIRETHNLSGILWSPSSSPKFQWRFPLSLSSHRGFVHSEAFLARCSFVVWAFAGNYTPVSDFEPGAFKIHLKTWDHDLGQTTHLIASHRISPLKPGWLRPRPLLMSLQGCYIESSQKPGAMNRQPDSRWRQRRHSARVERQLRT